MVFTNIRRMFAQRLLFQEPCLQAKIPVVLPKRCWNSRLDARQLQRCVVSGEGEVGKNIMRWKNCVVSQDF